MTKEKTESGEFFIKQRKYPHLDWQFWKRWRTSKSQREADAYRFLSNLGLPTPKVIRVEDQRNSLGLLTNSTLVLEKLPAVDLRHIFTLEPYQELRNDPYWRTALIQQIAHDLRLMHDHGFFHLNLNFRNIMVNPKQKVFPLTVYYIDATSAKYTTSPRFISYYQIKELAFLYRDSRPFFRPTEQLLFLLLYLKKQKLNQQDKMMVRRIIQYTRKKWNQKNSFSPNLP